MKNLHPEGFLIINKPKEISSFYCVKYIKKLLRGKIKVGHTGALDNFATGLLIICIGRNATKMSNSLLALDKTYIVKAKFGELTDTLDHTGRVIAEKNISSITYSNIKKTIAKLETTYEQIPPIFSALKHKGIPLYKLARNKKNNPRELEKIVDNKKRTVSIFSIKILNFESPFLTFEACVSKGTYIRSLTNDIAKKLDNIATTYELKRTCIDNLSVNKAVHLNNLKSEQDIFKHLISYKKLEHLLKNYSSAKT